MKVYATYRNADMAEGRGPMVIDKVFKHEHLAKDYIDKQEGVMGRKAKWSQEKYGDWKVRELEILESAFDQDAEDRNRALNKLTEKEKRLLGLI